MGKEKSEDTDDSKRANLVTKINLEKERYQKILNDLRDRNNYLLDEPYRPLSSECSGEIELVNEPLDLIDKTLKYLDHLGPAISEITKERDRYEAIREDKGTFDLEIQSYVEALTEIRKSFTNFPDEILGEQISLLNRETNPVFNDFREILNSIYISQYGKEDVKPQVSSNYVTDYSEEHDLFKTFKSSETEKNLEKLRDLIADFELSFSRKRDTIREYISDREILEQFGIMSQKKGESFQEYRIEIERAKVDNIVRGNLYELLIKIGANVYDRVFGEEEEQVIGAEEEPRTKFTEKEVDELLTGETVKLAAGKQEPDSEYKQLESAVLNAIANNENMESKPNDMKTVYKGWQEFKNTYDSLSIGTSTEALKGIYTDSKRLEDELDGIIFELTDPNNDQKQPDLIGELIFMKQQSTMISNEIDGYLRDRGELEKEGYPEKAATTAQEDSPGEYSLTQRGIDGLAKAIESGEPEVTEVPSIAGMGGPSEEELIAAEQELETEEDIVLKPETEPVSKKSPWIRNIYRRLTHRAKEKPTPSPILLYDGRLDRGLTGLFQRREPRETTSPILLYDL